VTDRPVGTITVSNRTIDLAGEIVAISQIVSLRELDLELRRGFSSGRLALLFGGVFLLFFGSSVLGGGYASSGQGLISLIGLGVVLGVLIYSLYTRKRYILAIELASGRLSGLSARNSVALSNLKNAIHEVIENPPMHPTSINVGDVYAIDARGSQGNQFGSGNSQGNTW
jgi:hypothetical protein